MLSGTRVIPAKAGNPQGDGAVSVAWPDFVPFAPGVPAFAGMTVWHG